jgi:hypothetical protein
MRVRLGWVTAVVAFLVVVSGCSGGGDDSSPKPTTAGDKGGSSTTAKPATSLLPANVPRSEKMCALTSALAAKFKDAKKPDNPAALVPYIHDLTAFFEQAEGVAPAILVPDIKKLAGFYGPLADQIESGNVAAAANRPQLSDLAAASNRLREYFSKICGVDDSVFNL